MTNEVDSNDEDHRVHCHAEGKRIADVQERWRVHDDHVCLAAQLDEKASERIGVTNPHD